MSVTTITIKVDAATGAATVSTGVEAPAATVQLGEGVIAEAPAPTLLGGPGGAGAEGVAAQELTGAEDGPPPLDPQELGLGVGVAAEAVSAGLPPEPLVEASEAEAVEANEPMPIEELEKAAKPARRTKKT
jgi:hypothetical protein